MRHYQPERNWIDEERRIRREEEDEHIRLCNAGINQTHYVWKSEEEKAKWQESAKMGGGRFNEMCRRIHESIERRAALEST